MTESITASSIPSPLSGEGSLELLTSSTGEAASSLDSRDNPASEDIRKNLSARIHRRLFGWDKYLAVTERRFIIDAYDKEIIKVDLRSVEPVSTEEATADLKSDLEEIEDLELGTKPEWEAFSQGIVAVIVTEEERQRIAHGEAKTPFKEYYPKVSGDDPIPIPIDGLEEPRDQALSLLGLSDHFDLNDEKSIREAFRNYHYRNRVASKAAIEGYFRDNDRSSRPKLRAILQAPTIASISYRIEWKDDRGEPYMCWERGDSSGYFLVMNESRQKDWNRGEVERYPIHEILGHFGMLTVQSEEIKENNVDDIAAVLLIPDHRCWGFEGFAQTLDTFAGLDLSRHGRLSTALYRMYNRARTNAIFALEEGADMHDVVSKMLKYSFHKNPEEVRGELIKSQNDPFWRGYLAQYGTADSILMNLANNLEDDARIAFLRRGFKLAMTPRQLMQAAAEVLREHHRPQSYSTFMY